MVYFIGQAVCFCHRLLRYSVSLSGIAHLGTYVLYVANAYAGYSTKFFRFIKLTCRSTVLIKLRTQRLVNNHYDIFCCRIQVLNSSVSRVQVLMIKTASTIFF